MRGKTSRTGEEGEGTQSPHVFPAPSLAIFFVRAPLSERLEQVIDIAKIRDYSQSSPLQGGGHLRFSLF